MKTILRAIIRVYQLTLSSIFGRTCRHIPSCSAYTDEAIATHGAWPGVWMGAARIWRCRPLGSSGLDRVPERLNPQARWYTPWRYGHWTGAHIPDDHRLPD